MKPDERVAYEFVLIIYNKKKKIEYSKIGREGRNGVTHV